MYKPLNLTFEEWEAYQSGILHKDVANRYNITSKTDISCALLDDNVTVEGVVVTYKNVGVTTKDDVFNFQRAPYIECGWYILLDKGEYRVYYIPAPDWMGTDIFEGTHSTLKEAVEFARYCDTKYT